MPGMQHTGAGARDRTLRLDLEADLRHVLTANQSRAIGEQLNTPPGGAHLWSQ
jgi:hypothetical protein